MKMRLLRYKTGTMVKNDGLLRAKQRQTWERQKHNSTSALSPRKKEATFATKTRLHYWHKIAFTTVHDTWGSAFFTHLSGSSNKGQNTKQTNQGLFLLPQQGQSSFLSNQLKKINQLQ